MSLLNPIILINTDFNSDLYYESFELFINLNSLDNYEGLKLFDIQQNKNNLEYSFLELLRSIENVELNKSYNKYIFVIPIFFREKNDDISKLKNELSILFKKLIERRMSFSIRTISVNIIFYSPEEIFDEKLQIFSEFLMSYNNNLEDNNIFFNVFLFSNRNGYEKNDIIIEFYNLLNLISFNSIDNDNNYLFFLPERVLREDRAQRINYFCTRISSVEYPEKFVLKLSNYNIIEKSFNYNKNGYKHEYRISNEVEEDIKKFINEKIENEEISNYKLNELNNDYKRKYSDFFKVLIKESESIKINFFMKIKNLIKEINKKDFKKNIKFIEEEYYKLFDNEKISNLHDQIANEYENHIKELKEDFNNRFKENFNNYLINNNPAIKKWDYLKNFFRNLKKENEKEYMELEKNFFEKGEIFIDKDKSIRNNFIKGLEDSFNEFIETIRNIKYPLKVQILLNALFSFIFFIINIHIDSQNVNYNFYFLVFILIFNFSFYFLFLVIKYFKLKKAKDLFCKEIKRIEREEEKFLNNYIDLIKKFWKLRILKKINEIFDIYEYFCKNILLKLNDFLKDLEEENKEKLNIYNKVKNLIGRYCLIPELNKLYEYLDIENNKFRIIADFNSELLNKLDNFINKNEKIEIYKLIKNLIDKYNNCNNSINIKNFFDSDEIKNIIYEQANNFKFYLNTQKFSYIHNEHVPLYNIKYFIIYKNINEFIFNNYYEEIRNIFNTNEDNFIINVPNNFYCDSNRIYFVLIYKIPDF